MSASTTKCWATLYYDTGLSPRVTLLWAHKLDGWTHRTMEEVYFTRDTIYKGSIRLNLPVRKVERADIIKIQVLDADKILEDYYYDVLSVNGLSADTTEVQIQIDPILSLGGAGKIGFAYGHITRGHTYKDRVTLSPEPYIFSDNLEHYQSAEVWPAKTMDGLSGLVSSGDGDADLIVSSMALDRMDVDGVNTPDADPVKWFFGNKEVGYNLNRIRFPQITTPTTFIIGGAVGGFGLTNLGNLKVFKRTPYTKASLEYLVGLAYDDPVFSEYKIPNAYITIGESNDSKGGITTIEGNNLFCRTGAYETNNNLPPRLRDFCEYGITSNAHANGPKNSKILKCYSAIVASVRATGQKLMYSGADLKSWGVDPKIGVEFNVWCDPTPGGRNYLTFKGVANSGGVLTRSLASEGWQKPTVKTETSFGYTLAQRQVSAEIFSRFCDVAGAVALTAGLGVAGGLSAAGGATLSGGATGTALSFGEGASLGGAQGLSDLAVSQGAKQLASSQMIKGVKSGGSIPGAYARMQDLQNRNFGTVMQVGNNNGFAIAARNTFDLDLYAPSATDIEQLDYMFNTYGYTQYTDVVMLQEEIKKEHPDNPTDPENGVSVFALRPNFTYLQIPDCVIRYGGGENSHTHNTRNLTELAEEQFKAGVFIQKKIPKIGEESEMIRSNWYRGYA